MKTILLADVYVQPDGSEVGVLYTSPKPLSDRIAGTFDHSTPDNQLERILAKGRRHLNAVGHRQSVTCDDQRLDAPAATA